MAGQLSIVRSPDDYRRDAGFRRSEAPHDPIREGSPESDNAQPSSGMISRDAESNWLPGAYLKQIAANPDTILQKDGYQGFRLYEAILDDDVCMSALQQRRLAITSRDWEVAPGDKDDPLSVKAADDFRDMLKGVGFDRATGGLHFGVWFGFAVGEGIYSTKLHDGRQKVWLDDIVIPDRRWFGFTTEGELRYTAALNSVDGESLPENKFVSVRTGGTHDFAFYGLGLAHWCYWPVFFKRSALKFWALYLEKFGMPTVVIGFDEGQKDDATVKASLLQAGVAIGQDRSVIMPTGNMGEDRLRLMEATRNGGGASSYKDFVAAQDEALMRVILGQPGTSKGVSSGLNSDQASVHSDVKAEIVKADSDLISEAINRTFAKWLTRWNYGPDVAPPTVYRVLDDPEDINTIADRDVKLKGLGIIRTEASVAEVYGDGYEYTPPPTPEEAAKQALALAQASAGGAAKPANNNQPANTRAAAFAAEYGVDDEQPLYVRRDLLNRADIAKWAKEQGLGNLVPDLHVTVLYSKTPVDWFKMGESWLSMDDAGGVIIKPGGPRKVETLGEGAIVLRFSSSDIQYRHESMVENGASHDYDDYKPHVTITYDGGDIDLSTVEPYTGELRFGPEIFEPIKAKPTDPGLIAFSADEDAAIERLIDKLVADTDPVFAAIADELRTNLQGVTTIEGARIAMLSAWERLPHERLARLTGLPMFAERAAAVAGVDGDVTA